MVTWLTPYSSAKGCCISPASKQNLIHRTSLSDKTELPFFSPGKALNLPFFSMSRMLSPCVPSNRCSGFTHAGLSQWWQALCIGNDPKWIANESRWARTKELRNRTTPYPCSFLYRFHSQQGFPFSTFDQNRLISFSVKTIDGTTGPDVDETSISCRILCHSISRVKQGMRLLFL